MTPSKARSPAMSALGSRFRSTPSSSCSTRSRAARTSNRLRFQDVDRGEVAVELVVVEPIAHDEGVGNVEPLVADGNLLDPALFFIEEDAELQRCGPVALDMLEEKGRR